MAIKRGTYQKEHLTPQEMMPTSTRQRYSAKPVSVPDGQTSSEIFLAKRGVVGNANDPVKESKWASPVVVNSAEYKNSQALYKTASTMTSPSGAGYTGTQGEGISTMAPEVYSPLFQMANLQLPRDRVTMNAWNRNFYDTHPLVHNCINLHATYPIGKIHIQCPDKKVEQFFQDWMEQIDLPSILQEVALEFFKLGEVFPYATLDETEGVWSNIEVQNPDYVNVKQSVLGGSPIISLIPDAALKRLVQSSNPADRQIQSQLSPEILYRVKKGQNIPLDNTHISHLKRLSSPYDVRGTSMIVSIYKDLILYDQLRECYSNDTEVLTDEGFIGGDTLARKYLNGEKIPNIACFNPERDIVEMHQPTNAHSSFYNGEMYHFNGDKVDTLVTPNHRIWLKTKKKSGWGEWHFERADEVKNSYYHKFRSQVEWPEGEYKETIDVFGHKIDTNLWMRFIGHVVSDGCVYQNSDNGRYDNLVLVSQKSGTESCDKMLDIFNKVALSINKHAGIRTYLMEGTFNKNKPIDYCNMRMHGKDITNYFIENTGRLAKNKHLPSWVFGLNKIHLESLLDGLMDGDGCEINTGNKKSFRYSTASKQLADDVYRLVYQLGYSPNIHISQRKTCIEYTVLWSDTDYGNEPLIFGNKNHGGANIDTISYSGNVWCFEVPTGLFITRRNNKIIVQGNSKYVQATSLINPITLVKVGGTGDGAEAHVTDEHLEAYRRMIEAAEYDRNFKLITHAAVQIERVGASGSIVDTAADFEFITNNILYGLMTPKAIITEEGPTYSSSTVGLEVLKQRYEAFRNLISRWLKIKIFAPISEIQDFFQYKDGERKLIVPEVRWNQMILFDMQDYIGLLKDLTNPGSNGEPPKVSRQTLFESLGLDVKKEQRRVRQEMVEDMIYMREKQIVSGSIPLGTLKSIKEGEDIVEPDEKSIPGVPGAGGVMPGTGSGGGFGGDMGGGLGGSDMGGGLGGSDMGGGLGGGEAGGLGV